MDPCNQCPVIERVEKLEQKMSQIQTETKQNDRAITSLSRDLALHMQKSEQRADVIESGINKLTSSFEKHMTDEKATIQEIKDHFNATIKPVSDKMKDFDGVKIKNGIMWAIMVSLGGIILSGFLFIAQQKYTEYKEEKKQAAYSDSERAAFLKFKAKQIEKRLKDKE